VKEKIESVMDNASTYKKKRNVALARKLMPPGPKNIYIPNNT
jgi:hypothetical protein